MPFGVIVPPFDAEDEAFVIEDGREREIALSWAHGVLAALLTHNPLDAIRACRVIVANNPQLAPKASQMLVILQEMICLAEREDGVAA